MNTNPNDWPQRPEQQMFLEKALAALYAISQLLSGQAAQREMLARVMDLLAEHMDMVRGTLLLYAADSGELVLEVSQGSPAGEGAAARYRMGEGIVGQVLQTGRPEIVPHIHEDSRFQGRIHGRDVRREEGLSFVCVPVTLGSQVLGTLSADLFRADRSLLEDAQRFLSVVAGLVAYDVRARQEAAQARRAMEAENLRLRHALGEQLRPENIVGQSEAMRTVYERIHQVAGSQTTVLIRGESGTGKELVAAAIHFLSERRERPFIRVNCAALNEGLIESELFGHEQGAFTGALRARAGRVEEAGGGTLFLDEIGDFSPTVQVKLLRVLQEREYERVGGNDTRNANVRVITATNRNLERAVESGQFRQDLYYRINVFPIPLPPLRERRGDVLLLADHFVQKHALRLGKPVHRISTAAINAMLAYHWPGNVRELENCIEHAMLLAADGVIHAQNLPPSLRMPEEDERARAGTLKAATRVLERDMIIDALKRYDGNVTNAAGELGITPRMVRYKVQQLQLGYLRSSRRRPRNR